VFHLTPGERREDGVTESELRASFVADVGADDPARREYVDVHFEDMDLSALVVDGNDVGPITFREVTIDGTFDLSGSVVTHPIAIEDSRIGQLDVTATTFEMDVTVEESTFGWASDAATCLRARRGSFDRGLQISDVRFDASVEFAACDVEEWLEFDSCVVGGGAHFPNVSVGRAQFVSTTFENGVEFTDASIDIATFDRVETGDTAGTLDLTDGSIGRLRVFPGGAIECHLHEATVSTGRLGQPDDGVATYDLTDATIGSVDLDCDADTFDRYRFYRTRFDGFPFQGYREMLRESHWRLHDYVRDPELAETVEGLEHTYLEAKQGASEAGDGETASMFFVRELRYRRQRYATHAAREDYSLAHRADATVRLMTNAFLDVVAGYGERPQRTVVLSLVVILGSALVYPATAGLTTGDEVVTYAGQGAFAALDGLYFSVVTFATLGLGDVHPVGDVGRIVAASEGLAGAFLTALFVFSLGRRVTR
jgi:hypothetical protein